MVRTARTCHLATSLASTRSLGSLASWNRVEEEPQHLALDSLIETLDGVAGQSRQFL